MQGTSLYLLATFGVDAPCTTTATGCKPEPSEIQKRDSTRLGLAPCNRARADRVHAEGREEIQGLGQHLRGNDVAVKVRGLRMGKEWVHATFRDIPDEDRAIVDLASVVASKAETYHKLNGEWPKTVHGALA